MEDISKYSDDELKQMLSEMGEMPRPDHEDLEGGVSGMDSMHVPPELKPVIKGTKKEIKNIKAQGLAQKRVLFIANDAAYLIDPKAVQGIYGTSLSDSIKFAKKDLKAGGDTESLLLGYPPREGLSPMQTQDAAVTKQGEVITDLPAMKQEKENDNVAWAAEGLPEDVMQMAIRIAKAIAQKENDNEED